MPAVPPGVRDATSTHLFAKPINDASMPDSFDSILNRARQFLDDDQTFLSRTFRGSKVLNEIRKFNKVVSENQAVLDSAIAKRQKELAEFNTEEGFFAIH